MRRCLGYYRKNSKDALLLRDLIKDPLLLIEKEVEEKAQVPGGFKLGTNWLRDRLSNHFTTTKQFKISTAVP